MFGGIAFMIGGNMACGIVGQELMVRCGADAYEAALARPHARVMDFTGRVMKGFLTVGVEGIREDRDLEEWVQLGVRYAKSLPKK